MSIFGNFSVPGIAKIDLKWVRLGTRLAGVRVKNNPMLGLATTSF